MLSRNNFDRNIEIDIRSSELLVPVQVMDQIVRTHDRLLCFKIFNFTSEEKSLFISVQFFN
jgi:hypothetical protein